MQQVGSGNTNSERRRRKMPSKLSIFWSVLITSVLILCGCGQAKSQEVSIDVSCDDFSEVQSISQETVAPIGGLLVVTLCSNPTTGYKWETAEISDQTVLEEKSHTFVSPEADKAAPRVGAAGQEVWTFKVLRAGTSTISIAYSQPWEGGDKAAWTYDLTVVVQ
jgi:inhibitor of cysteine peptidase